MASSTSTPSGHGSKESWTNKLNKALVAVGVIVLGLFVTDSLLDTFSGDPAQVQAVAVPSTSDNAVAEVAEPVRDTAVAAEDTLAAAAGEGSDTGASVTGGESVAAVTSSGSVPLAADSDSLTTLQNLFGSRLVFVSAAEPVYVVTEDERRFEVGSMIGDDYSLAGIETDQLIVEREGDLTVLTLPDPVTQ